MANAAPTKAAKIPSHCPPVRGCGVQSRQDYDEKNGPEIRDHIGLSWADPRHSLEVEDVVGQEPDCDER